MSRAILETHRRVFRSKAVLADVYGVWFDRVIADLAHGARVLEPGAGPGFFAERARAARPDLRWVAIDILRAPWNDLAADAHRLPFSDATFDAVAGVDFVHHLREPLRFAAEAARVLKPGGTARFVEPWVSPFSWPIYRFLHQESCRLDLDPARPFGGGATKDPFDGDAGVAHALRNRVSESTWRSAGFDPPRFEPMNAFAYLASLGFKEANLLPRPLLRPLQALDARAPVALFALRTVVTLRRAG